MKKVLALILMVIVFFGVFLGWKKYYYLDPNSPATYYKIFNRNEIVSEKEEKASEVIEKLDKRLEKYRRTFAKMAGTNEQEKLRALFMMNFVQMLGYYEKRDLPEKQDFKHLFFNTEANNCQSNALMLQMLLERAGYETRTIAINDLSHGYNEVKFKDGWQVLDSTTNLWINKSTEELISGKSRNVKAFYLKAEDMSNKQTIQGIKKGYNVSALKSNMQNIGIGYDAKIDKYNYIDMSEWSY